MNLVQGPDDEPILLGDEVYRLVVDMGNDLPVGTRLRMASVSASYPMPGDMVSSYRYRFFIVVDENGVEQGALVFAGDEIELIGVVDETHP